MTKGQKIAEIYVDATFRDKCGALIDVAIAEAEKAQRERCAEAYTRWVECYQTSYTIESAAKAILDAVASMVIVWKHKLECPTPYQWNDGWVFSGTGFAQVPAKTARFCDGCGAPKPEVKND